MQPAQRRGPLFHRFLIVLFSFAFGVLVFWLLGFILEDINRLPGPSYRAIEEAQLDPALAEKDVELSRQIRQAGGEIERLTKQQQILKSGIENSQRAVSQLEELQRLSIAKGEESSGPTQEALVENIRLFLADQRSYQELNQKIVERNAELEDLKLARAAHQEHWNELRRPLRVEFNRLNKRHNYRLAGFKLALLVPLLLVWGLLFCWYGGTYAPLIFAAGIAIAAKIIQVIHEHFPSRLFNYILTLVALAVVTSIVVYLLRMIKNPKPDWLMKRYREAYEAFLCPVCDYPIRRGPLKYMSWTRRSIRKAIYRAPITLESQIEDTAYTCPICATQLFEPCQKCQAIRHSLLPSCHACGDVVAKV